MENNRTNVRLKVETRRQCPSSPVCNTLGDAAMSVTFKNFAHFQRRPHWPNRDGSGVSRFSGDGNGDKPPFRVQHPLESGRATSRSVGILKLALTYAPNL